MLITKCEIHVSGVTKVKLRNVTSVQVVCSLEKIASTQKGIHVDEVNTFLRTRCLFVNYRIVTSMLRHKYNVFIDNLVFFIYDP